ncbi:MAG TPA: flavodoxin domain-containing protein, partial [Spirochaetota bacterium]|nr:flavodoxin domain-containing protein [Spirochaetota bacterium]
MKGIIIYSSQYGSTKQYAQWLGEDLKLETVSYKDIKVKELEKYDFLILGSSIAAYKLTLSAWIIKNWEKLNTKKLFLFTVSGANPNDKKIGDFLDNSFSKDIQNKMEIFSLHGRMIFKKLPFMIQIVMKMVKNTQKDPET